MRFPGFSKPPPVFFRTPFFSAGPKSGGYTLPIRSSTPSLWPTDNPLGLDTLVVLRRTLFPRRSSSRSQSYPKLREGSGAPQHPVQPHPCDAWPDTVFPPPLSCLPWGGRFSIPRRYLLLGLAPCSPFLLSVQLPSAPPAFLADPFISAPVAMHFFRHPGRMDLFSQSRDRPPGLAVFECFRSFLARRNGLPPPYLLLLGRVAMPRSELLRPPSLTCFLVGLHPLNGLALPFSARFARSPRAGFLQSQLAACCAAVAFGSTLQVGVPGSFSIFFKQPASTPLSAQSSVSAFLFAAKGPNSCHFFPAWAPQSPGSRRFCRVLNSSYWDPQFICCLPVFGESRTLPLSIFLLLPWTLLSPEPDTPAKTATFRPVSGLVRVEVPPTSRALRLEDRPFGPLRTY